MIDFYLESKLGKWFASNCKISQDDFYFSRDSTIIDILKARDANLLSYGETKNTRAFSITFKSKIPSEITSRYNYFLNIHPGYLPTGRGTFPIFWAVFTKTKCGITVHQITDKMDFGPILLRQEVYFSSSENSGELSDKVFELEKQILPEAVHILRTHSTISFLQVDMSNVGINRKKSDFLYYLNSPPLNRMDKHEIKRLALAVTHHDYPKPDWLISLSKF